MSEPKELTVYMSRNEAMILGMGLEVGLLTGVFKAAGRVEEAKAALEVLRPYLPKPPGGE